MVSVADGLSVILLGSTFELLSLAKYKLSSLDAVPPPSNNCGTPLVIPILKSSKTLVPFHTTVYLPVPVNVADVELGVTITAYLSVLAVLIPLFAFE